MRDAYILVAVAWCVAIGLGYVGGATDTVGWYRLRLPDPYADSDYSGGVGFFFAPPIAFAMYPLLLLPWTWFAAVWTGIMFAALYVLVGRWSALALLLPPVWWELHAANVNLLIALAACIGLRYPAAWSFVLLTKITPGVGLIWHLVRREWHALFVAGSVTAGISAVTFVVAPGLWFDWFASLSANVGNPGPGYFTVPITLPFRLALGTALVAWGARTDRRWTVPVAVCLGMPVLWFNALAALIGVVYFLRPTRR